MHKARSLFALSFACANAGCGTEVALAVYPVPADAGVPGLPEKPPQCGSTKLIDRLSYGAVPLPEAVRYKRTGYFFGLPQDDRIAFSMLNNHVGMVAWVNSSGTTVHVTFLAVGPDSISRVGADVPVDGTELSGLVALDDGFALLTRRPDIGEPIGPGMTQEQATFLVRWQNGGVTFAVPLTGTRSIVNVSDLALKRDFPNPVTGYPNPLSGRLAFNGSHFGAYFSVRGGVGDAHGLDSHADKFVEVDQSGQYVGGWRMGCRQSLGNRLVAEPSGFTAFCMSDGLIDTPGLRYVWGAGSSRRLASESVTREGAYVGGNFGSAVKIADGYVIAWASRGVTAGSSVESPIPSYDLHEPAAIILDNSGNLIFKDWPFLAPAPRPIRDAVNLHASPYGDKVLFVWETIDSPRFVASNGYSTGAYGGTHFRLMDTQGKPASDDEIMPTSIAPNGQDEIVQLPSGDLLWAYVPEVRDFQMPVTSMALPSLPPIYEIKFVRLRYCIP
jgi:hypothetical protein